MPLLPYIRRQKLSSAARPKRASSICIPSRTAIPSRWSSPPERTARSRRPGLSSWRRGLTRHPQSSSRLCSGKPDSPALCGCCLTHPDRVLRWVRPLWSHVYRTAESGGFPALLSSCFAAVLPRCFPALLPSCPAVSQLYCRLTPLLPGSSAVSPCCFLALPPSCPAASRFCRRLALLFPGFAAVLPCYSPVLPPSRPAVSRLFCHSAAVLPRCFPALLPSYIMVPKTH